MKEYTAKEMTNVLQQEGDEEITLRKVRYYAQRGMLPERTLSDGKLVYTDEHLNHLRMIRALKKTGKKLDNIKGSLDALPSEDIRRISTSHYGYIQDLSENFQDKTIETVNEDISVTFSSRVDQEMRTKIVGCIQNCLKEKGEEST